MTAWGSVDVAVEAMRRGARDFVQKPWENARLVATLRTQAELSRALRRGQRLEAENLRAARRGPPAADRRVRGDAAGARDDRARRPLRRERADHRRERHAARAASRAALHAVSSRSGKPLLTVNAGGLSEGVFESELFGHVKGAFTDAKADRVGRFEMADGGALFLDEIANVPLNLQPKLLRVLETGEFERVGSSRTRARRRADPLGHERRRAPGGGERPLPPGPAVPPQHDRDPRAAAARPARGHPAARRPLPAPARASATASRSTRLRRRRHARRCWPTAGRATSASSTTPWSARC